MMFISKSCSYCTFALLLQTTSDSGKILRQQCVSYWQSKCKISVKSAKANNSYSSFCEITSKHFNFRSLCLTLSKRPETSVWSHLTKVTVTIVCFGRFNWNLPVWLTINDAVLTQNFVRIRCCLLELHKCTITAGLLM